MLPDVPDPCDRFYVDQFDLRVIVSEKVVLEPWGKQAERLPGIGGHRLLNNFQ
jgi:hypothetical protein